MWNYISSKLLLAQGLENLIWNRKWWTVILSCIVFCFVRTTTWFIKYNKRRNKTTTKCGVLKKLLNLLCTRSWTCFCHGHEGPKSAKLHANEADWVRGRSSGGDKQLPVISSRMEAPLSWRWLSHRDVWTKNGCRICIRLLFGCCTSVLFFFAFL